MRWLILLALSTALFADGKPFVAHEWGTFTSMQGSDGISLDGLYHEEAGLPPFVYRRSAQKYAYAEVRSKMETPVIYFYTGEERTVKVRVDFPEGVMTQWYPGAFQFGPELAEEGQRPEAKKGFLDWNETLLVPDKGQAEPIPDVDASDPWTFARRTDSAFVKSRWGSHKQPDQWEKYLFYRGLGTFTMPVRVTSEKGGMIAIHNEGKQPIQHVFVLSVVDGHAAFSYTARVEAGSTLAVEAELHPKGDTVDDNAKELGKQLEASLQACGLYPKEAVAMVRTWEKSYFHTPGLRVLYVVPREQTDALLPLTIDPKPDEMVRVLLARVEVLTPEHEALVERFVVGLGSEDYSAREAASKGIASLGRFAEPNLRRAIAHSTDPEVRQRCQQLLDEMMPSR